MTGLRERIEAQRRLEVEREHRDTRGQHDRDDCPLCARRPSWSRSLRAKELTR